MYWRYYVSVGMILLMFALGGCQGESTSQRNTSAELEGIRYTISDVGVLEI